MIEVFKIVKQKYDTTIVPEISVNSSSVTRGNNYKLLNQTFTTTYGIYTEDSRGAVRIPTLPIPTVLSSYSRIAGLGSEPGYAVSYVSREAGKSRNYYPNMRCVQVGNMCEKYSEYAQICAHNENQQLVILLLQIIMATLSLRLAMNKKLRY